MLNITRVSSLSGVKRIRRINVTYDQLLEFANGAHAQVAFPHLDADDREFIMTGITPDEWESIREDDDDD